MKTLLLIDGNALLYRAYHAFPKELTTSDGAPIGAVYGFTRILLSTIAELKPEQVAVCFDLKGPTFRHEQMQEYKANREAMPQDLADQIETAHNVVRHLELPIYALQRYEADDCIATITRQALETDPQIEVVILSGDMDLLQLVRPRVSVLRPATPPKEPIRYTPAKVVEQYSFGPDLVPDYKGLRGDPSDNIPGVPGIGEVTAKKLLSHGNLDAIYAALETGTSLEGISASVAKKLLEHKELALHCRQIATVDSHVDVAYDATLCRLELTAPEALVELFRKLGFRSLMQYLPSTHKALTAVADVFGESETEYQPTQLAPKTKSDELDEALAPVLRKMEAHGVLIDRAYLKALETQLTTEIAEIKATLAEMATEPFNPDSPMQVGRILYDVMKIPTTFIRKGKTGYTTDAATLTELSAEYPIASKLLEYRELTKLQSTYVLPLQELADEHGRIHTTYTPDAASGRLSSRNPNLQNIPVRSENGRRVRKAFIAPAGKVLVGADYSQMELRVAAHLSGDETLKEIFASGRDIHAETAAKMNVDRRVAKIINFSILYGKGAFGFAGDLGVSMTEAKAYIEQYFATYPKLRIYLDSVVRDGRENGYVETMFGRRRQLPDLRSANANRRAAAEREAYNHPIQGSQADILKLAMINLAPRLPKGATMILTVHDELVLEVDEAVATEAGTILKQTMESAVALSVPVTASVKQGKAWSEMEPTT